MAPKPTATELWGLSFGEYLQDFTQRKPGSPDFAMGMKEVYPADRTGFIPLAKLAGTLVALETVLHPGYQQAFEAFPSTIASLRRYHKANKKVFQRYYGFVCIRIILCVIQAGLLVQSGSINSVSRNISSTDDPKRISDVLAAKAALQMHAAMQGSPLEKILGMPLQSGQNALPCIGGISASDARFLSDILWQDRKSFLILGNRGFMRECIVLFFLISGFGTLSQSRDLQLFQWFKQTQDIMLRYYLGGADQDRITVRHLCLQFDAAIKGSKIAEPSAVDPQDARAIVESFIQLLSPPIPLNLREVHLLDITTLLFEFTYDNLRPSEMQDLIPDVMKCALARSWMEYDAEQSGFMAPTRRGFVRRYMGDMCHYIRVLKDKMNSDQGLSIYAHMLLDVDIVNLLGRTLLLLMRETQRADKWGDLLDGIDDLVKSLRTPLSFAETVFAPAHEDWIKVLQHFKMLIGDGTRGSRSQGTLYEAAEAWLDIDVSTLAAQMQIRRIATSALTLSVDNAESPITVVLVANMPIGYFMQADRTRRNVCRELVALSLQCL